MNILLTCVGRRSYMVDYFKRAIGGNGLVVATNSVLNTTGMQQADIAYVVEESNSNRYIDKVMEICRRHDIAAIISLFDIDLPFLASARPLFEEAGVKVWVSDPAVIETANDKWKTFLFLAKHGLNTPASYIDFDQLKKAIDLCEISFPIIVKPRYGMGSLSVFLADDFSELVFFSDYVTKQIQKSYLSILSKSNEPAILFQEYIEGTEYGVDVLNTYSCSPISVVAKKKHEMRSGETDSAITIRDDSVEKMGWMIGGLLRHRGNLDIDLIEHAHGNGIYVLELNARFGGGYPFSHLAGADFPAAIVQMSNNESPSDSTLYALPGVEGYKYIDPRSPVRCSNCRLP